jgi:hypothetical protein
MSPTAMLPSTAERLGDIYATAADHYLVSYLILTRFPESSPYTLGFALAHCVKVSVKAAFFQVNKQAPPTGQKAIFLKN